MIRAEDLMIGDYVHNSKGERCKVYGISNMMESNIELDNLDKENDGCFEMEFEVNPIPLTPEILEKNGFNKDGESYFFAHDFYDLEISEVSDGNWLVVLSDCEFNLPHNQVFASHVHDLQHALRIFGTDKTIEL